MKILFAANLGLGSNALPPLFARRFAECALAHRVEHCVVLNPFAPTPDHRAALRGKDYGYTLGEFGEFWRVTAIAGLHLALGHNDLWLDHPQFRDIREGYEARGAVILRGVTTELAGLLVASGTAPGTKDAPAEPPHRLTDWLHLTRPPLSDTERVGVRREYLCEFADWAWRRRIPALVHGLPGLPTWGRAGESWVGGPGAPPHVLLVDTGHLPGSQIIRV